MIALQKIKNLISELENISIGFSEINFIIPEHLEAEQTGYRVDSEGNSLVTGQPGDWQESWLVIASDSLGDPIFFDCYHKCLPVFTAPFGEGIWEAVQIADGFEQFKILVRDLKLLSVNRDSPTDLKHNPIPPTEITKFVQKMEQNNPSSDFRYWETFLTECL